MISPTTAAATTAVWGKGREGCKRGTGERGSFSHLRDTRHCCGSHRRASERPDPFCEPVPSTERSGSPPVGSRRRPRECPLGRSGTRAAGAATQQHASGKKTKHSQQKKRERERDLATLTVVHAPDLLGGQQIANESSLCNCAAGTDKKVRTEARDIPRRFFGGRRVWQSFLYCFLTI